MVAVTATARRPSHRRLTSLQCHVVAVKPSDINPSPFDFLPTELQLDILETVLAEPHGPISSLLLICKGLTQLVEHILYRTIRLPTNTSIHKFHRTIKSKSSLFLEVTVKEIDVTCASIDANAGSQLQEIVAMCSGIRKLALPSTRGSTGFLNGVLLASSRTISLRELTLESYREDLMWVQQASAEKEAIQNTCATLTHLRICQPSDAWYRPTYILDRIGHLPQLTHLFLARRANANENNDVIFAEDVRTILASRPNLVRLVVGIFARFKGGNEADFNIIQLLRPFAVEDERLVIRHVPRGSWTAQRDW